MKINFYLPGIGLKIIGGYKIVFQYANYLASMGNDVYIYYDINNGKNNKKISPKIYYLLKKLLVLVYPYYWFKLKKSIYQKVVYQIDNKSIRDADISIATAYRTCELVEKLDKDKGKKIYFIQDYEKWGTITDEMLIDTYKKNPIVKITTYAARCIQNAHLTLWNYMTYSKQHLKHYKIKCKQLIA